MRCFSPTRALGALTLLAPHFFSSLVHAIDLDPTQPDQVRNAAKDVAEELVSMYAKPNGGPPLSGIPGLLTYPPYYWWEAGAMFGQLIEYWYYTNDSSYNDMIKEGILHQIGEQKNLMPSNQSKDEGNDDQLFWAFTVMSAAELGFENPPDDQPGWLALAQSVFNQLVGRWDEQNCGGGLRWQIYQWLGGWTYKNTASNGGMFQLAARLALYTGNETYAKYANQVFDWLDQSPLLTDDWQVYDGTDVEQNCTQPDRTQWTYNYGIMIGGAAYMYNYTNGSQIWHDRLSGFLSHIGNFLPKDKGGAMVEICEAKQVCNADQLSFKGYLARWLALSAQLAPFTHAQILPILQASAKAAAQTCTGASTTSSGNYMCGNQWYKQGFDGNGGAGQQMSVLSVISANLIDEVAPPFSANSGGTSQGDPSLGTGGDEELPTYDHSQITTADKAGASIITIMAVVFTAGGAWWLMM